MDCVAVDEVATGAEPGPPGVPRGGLDGSESGAGRMRVRCEE